MNPENLSYPKIRATFTLLLLFIVGCEFKNESSSQTNLLPGAKIYDVTNPASWSGDSTLAATPDDPSDDDAPAINAALQAAADFIDSVQVGIEVDWENYGKQVYQQLVYLPAGTYHLETAVVFPASMAYPERWGRKERFIWLHGAGEKETILELKSAEDIGFFGSDTLPKPIVQVVQYDPETYQGNDNFQLFVTDLSILSPADQPHTIGLSYGVSNIGAARNLTIKAGGEGGKVGFAFVQRNTGPGIVDNVTVEGFDKGVEIIDPWGEVFTFEDITVRNQNAGGIGLSVADKQIGLENFTSEQDQPDVTPILLHDDDYFNTMHGGAPHLTLISASITSAVETKNPAIVIEKGHIYLRKIQSDGYGENIILDHGQSRAMGQEYVSVHGQTDQQEDNVIYTLGNAPEQSLMLPIEASPEMPADALSQLQAGDFTMLSQDNLENGEVEITTSWVVVDPTKGTDDTRLLQAAINSGARFVGILNTEPLRISETIVINGDQSKNLELIFGYMSEIHVMESFALNQDLATDEKIAFQIENGNSESLIFKGFLFTADGGNQADFLLFQNNSNQNVVLEDLRCIHAPLVYRNSEEATGSSVFFNNIEFVYFGPSTEAMLQFDNQNVWGRQFDIEWLGHTDIAHQPLVVNNGGKLWLISQKYGEHNGVFVQTENGGQTELLSAYYNTSRTRETPPEITTNFMVKGTGSQFSMTGQERVRTRFDEQGHATRDLPHGNQFGLVVKQGDTTAIEGTTLPTYLKFEGLNPFQDTSYENYNRKNHFRVAGLLRVDVE